MKSEPTYTTHPDLLYEPKTYCWKQVKRATQVEKAQMAQMVIDENQSEKELFHPVTDEDTYSIFKLEYHQGYQLQAYRADAPEKMQDCSYHQLIARCGKCQELMTIDGDYSICTECWTEYDDSP